MGGEIWFLFFTRPPFRVEASLEASLCSFALFFGIDVEKPFERTPNLLQIRIR
jgi:hypothetical protein